MPSPPQASPRPMLVICPSNSSGGAYRRNDVYYVPDLANGSAAKMNQFIAVLRAIDNHVAAPDLENLSLAHAIVALYAWTWTSAAIAGTAFRPTAVTTSNTR